jgi:hypothetical protein
MRIVRIWMSRKNRSRKIMMKKQMKKKLTIKGYHLKIFCSGVDS